ncbi:MAG TPA: biotin/lipoate A/B protein ligase family protein [Bellilinea sp.]
MVLPFWRILFSAPAAGSWNMALDEAILEAVTRGDQPPTLRLYAWEPACLSLGHAQPIADLDLEALASRGWQVVRRPTGGRAILHTDELTYSISAHQDNPVMTGGILESYRRISLALVRGLETLGIDSHADSQYALPTGSVQQAAVCFEVPSNYEITANGRKLIGSAQARRGLGVLQHGSLPLYGDLTRITQVLNFSTPAEQAAASLRLLEHAATAEIILGTAPTWQQAADAFSTAFSDQLQLKLEVSQPGEFELARAQALEREKYANSAWTYRI